MDTSPSTYTQLKSRATEIKYIYEVFGKHSRSSQEAINKDKTQIFRLGDDMFGQNRNMTNSPIDQRIWHLSSILGHNSCFFFYFLIEFTQLMKNQLDAILGMLSILFYYTIFKMATITHWIFKKSLYLSF